MCSSWFTIMEEIRRMLDDALAYRVAKSVRIRDKWLYGYSLTTTALVMFYIIVLKLGIDKVPFSTLDPSAFPERPTFLMQAP